MRDRRMALLVALGVAATALVGCGSGDDGGDDAGSSSAPADGAGQDPKDMTMVNVVKIKGILWFDRMAEGDASFAARTGVQTRQEGADDTSPEKQVQIIADLIPQNPTAITVVPNSPEALHAVLGQARGQGIKVVSHEATGIQNVDIDIEAFDNAAFGERIMQNLAQCMGERGEYVQFVGEPTAKTHMQWVDAARDLQVAEFPDMARVGDPIESADDEQIAYDKAKQLLAQNPDIKGFQGSAANDVPGIARAVREAGRQNQICVMGTSVPSSAAEQLADGSIDKIFFWDPALAGEAQLQIALMLAQGRPIEAGTDLGIPGYESLTKMNGYDNVYVGDASLEADAKTVSQYNF
ncbi:substrate-binding domain-containing protein [Mycobacterium manitobense]|uniref:Substrate-binding domain-containing protein n=1 Tax=[Mycobacterium] manitobense TaxID=190147 RepID=A0A9X3BQI4_9MYCO|nr:substrate-binding domain-containing protein [[Mycobacterium] manitobense]MCV7173759.1 substrate-binding domain-containing protein [[Mycobacterium] manitobense]